MVVKRKRLPGPRLWAGSANLGKKHT